MLTGGVRAATETVPGEVEVGAATQHTARRSIARRTIRAARRSGAKLERGLGAGMGPQREAGRFADRHRHSDGSAAVEEPGRLTAKAAGNATSGERVEGGGVGSCGWRDPRRALTTLLDLKQAHR